MFFFLLSSRPHRNHSTGVFSFVVGSNKQEENRGNGEHWAGKWEREKIASKWMWRNFIWVLLPIYFCSLWLLLVWAALCVAIVKRYKLSNLKTLEKTLITDSHIHNGRRMKNLFSLNWNLPKFFSALSLFNISSKVQLKTSRLWVKDSRW